MTKLDTAQAALLTAIKESKADYDKWEAQALAQLDVLKGQQKEPLRKLVARAIEMGVPMRQIHLNGLGYKHVISMTTFLDGGAKLSAAHVLKGLNGTAGEARIFEDVLNAPVGGGKRPTFRQERGQAFWTDPHTGEERKIDRLDGPVYFYSMVDSDIAKLTEEERGWFYDDAKTLMGEAEAREYFDNGNEPARWDNQPDAKMRRV